MTLSSQSARSSRPGPRTRGKKNGLPWKPLLVLALLLGGIWFLFLRADDAAPPEASEATAATTLQDGNVADPAPETDREALGGGETSNSSEPARSGQGAASPRTVPAASTGLVRPSVVERLGEPAAGSGSGPAPPPQASNAPQRPAPEARGGRTSAAAAATLAEGFALLDRGELVAGRNRLSALLLESEEPLSIEDATAIRNRLTELNSRLVFSPDPVPNDNITTSYVVEPGDLLGSIAIRAQVPYPLLEIMNQTRAPRMQVGQNLKLLRGPVHARVSKTDFTMDLYAFGEDAAPVFLAALPVGLGANDGTPLGRWRVGRSKVINPSWKNPRTGEYFAADDPAIPIGEYWIPIEGLEGASVGRTGFGIHGTNEPDSIGSMQSMGCIRLLDGDIELVYHMLEPRASEVVIEP